MNRQQWLESAASKRQQAAGMADKARCYPKGSPERAHYEFFEQDCLKMAEFAEKKAEEATE